MSVLAQVKTADDVVESEDRVGGNFDPIPTGIHDVTIKLAYLGQSPGGANSVTFLLDAGGKEVRETIYFTNKQGENFYLEKNDKKTKRYLPGFTLVDDICLFCTEKGLLDGQATEVKQVKQYDPTTKTEIPKPAEVLVDLLGKDIKLAIYREIVFKEKKDNAGNYQPTNDTRTQNAIEKAVHKDTMMTINEYKHEVGSAEWATEWLKRNTNPDGSGKDRDKTRKGAAAAAGTSGSGMFGGGAAAGGEAGGAKKKLFG